MTDKKNIYQRLHSVMQEVKGVNKGNTKVNNQYKFVSHDAVAKALHDPLVNNGIMLVTSVNDIKQDGNRTSVNLVMSFVNIDDPKDFVGVSFPGYGIDPQDKGVGKAISYAFKYGLLKTFCLETGDDVEKDNIDYVSPDEMKLKEAAKDSELLEKFLVKFDDAAAPVMQKYINEVHDKYEIEYQKIIRKYNENPENFMEKFEKWKESSISKS